MIRLPIFFRVTSPALEPSCDGSSAGEVTLNDMGKISVLEMQQKMICE